MSLDSIINVQISRDTAAVSQAGFGTALILGPNTPQGEVRVYNSYAAVLEDYSSTDVEAIMASKAFAQQPSISTVKVARSELVSMVVEFTPTVEDSELYTVSLLATPDDEDPQVFNYTSSGSASAAEIVEGLIRTIMGEEIQEISYSDAPDGGSFLLHFGVESVEIDHDDNAGAIQTKLRTLEGLGAVNVTGDFTSGHEIVFRGFAGDAPMLAISANTLVDGATPVVIDVDVVTEGEARTHGVVATESGDKLVLTGAEGADIFYTNTANLTADIETPAASIVDAVVAASNVDDDWYFLLTGPRTNAVILAAAAYIEARRRMYFVVTSASDVPTSADDDIASLLKDSNYFRTSLFYASQATERHDAAFVGRMAPLDPGSETWAFKSLAAVPIDPLTDGQRNALDGKNVNYYTRLAGVSVTINGKTSGGEFCDVIRFIDWLHARMQEEIFGNLIRNDKIPFSNEGIVVIESSMLAVLKRGVTAGGIASMEDVSVTVPLAADVPQNDRAERRLTGIRFAATLAGAIHAVNIQGNVTI